MEVLTDGSSDGLCGPRTGTPPQDVLYRTDAEGMTTLEFRDRTEALSDRGLNVFWMGRALHA